MVKSGHIIISGMKKLSVLFASALYLATGMSVYAGPLDTGISVATPDKTAVQPNVQLNTILQNAINIVFVVAGLVVLVMLIWGAFQWILSGGDKEAVGKARGRIINALIGLAVLALAWFMLALVAQLIGINILGGKIPSLSGQ